MTTQREEIAQLIADVRREERKDIARRIRTLIDNADLNDAYDDLPLDLDALCLELESGE